MPLPTLLLNAGGASRRMGQPKALLPMPGSATPLIRHIATQLLPLAADLLVIANDPAILEALHPLPARWLTDAYPDSGPLGGLITGLRTCEGWCICVACDLPFVQPRLFRYLLSQTSQDWDAIVPRIGERLQPLHALYHPRCLPEMEAALPHGKRRMDSFLPQVRTRFVLNEEMRPYDPELRSFINVNTPEEWDAISGQAHRPPDGTSG